ncbi:flavin-binding monooxygenase like protein [Zymoseptoria brevis]|uniref:Flavin-binding monooxygenase like protein n=1 Tax=Zymoseptoria brevis TaxID=1047168 RepID=A0A0F4G9T8_9PEZI|nr:flavin-binding monooxygenase like protein [Zymoseptoria brevis]
MAWQAPEGENAYDIVVVGAGIAGINFGYRLQERLPNLTYTILEGRHELGGTWSLFKYPGIRSDSDLFTFGFPWRPWHEDSSIAHGGSIHKYMKESAAEYGIDKKIQYNTMVENADYSSASNSWTLQTKVNGEKNKTFKARWIMMCTGYYDYHNPMQVDIPGINNFKGQVIHPQFWPEDLDYANKDVVIIGSGATAVTVLPVMAEKAKHVTMLQRSPTYILAAPTEDQLEKFIRRWFSWAPNFQDRVFRLKWILAPMLMTTFSAWFPERAKAMMLKLTQAQLPANVPLDPHFTPSYYPWEQRLCVCPNGDFYKSLRQGKSSIATGHIENIDEKTIHLQNGQELSPDIIITATGLKLKFGGGMKVTVNGKPFHIPEKFTWKGVMIEDLPNAAFVVGYVDASWTLGADATAQMMTRMITRMKKEGVVEVTPHQSAKEKEEMKESSLLRLNSTYVKKGMSELPKSGDRGQWTPRSYYFKDIIMAWFGDIKTGTEWVRGV